ncbi:MAG: PEP-CTERM sorting domain-containing protein, partial [bacterium]
GGTTTVESGGIMNINGSGSTSYTSTINGGLTNDGQINLNRVSYYGGNGNLAYTGGDLEGSGDINVSSNAILTLTNNPDLHNNTVHLNGGVLRAPNGYTGGETIGYGKVKGTLGGPISVSDGTMMFEDTSTTISSTGTMDVTGTGTLSMNNNTLVNNGQLNIKSGGKLEMKQSAIDNTGGGTTTVESGGIMNINGSGSTSYTSTINGGLTNDGQINLNRVSYYGGLGRLNVEGGLVLGIGSTLNVSDYNSLTVTGDFDMRIIDEEDFAWGNNSELKLTGGVEAALNDWDQWARLEIGGMDSGASTGYDNNFDMFELKIGSNAHIFLSDWFNNQNSGSLAEALYLDDLTLLSGAYLNLNGLNLYVGGQQITAGQYDYGWIIDNEVPNSAVPLPSSLFLFGIGLLGLFGVAGNKKRA